MSQYECVAGAYILYADQYMQYARDILINSISTSDWEISSVYGII